MSEEIERTLTTIEECFAFKIPPQTSASGHRADSWPKEPAWSGKVVITAKGATAYIRLITKETGELFGVCPVTKDGPEGVSKVVDSSRYFVLRMVDEKSGRHAFIGIAFQARSDAFDFNVALSDHQTQVEREKQSIALQAAPIPSKDYSFKEGETIKIKLQTKKTPTSCEKTFPITSNQLNAAKSGDLRKETTAPPELLNRLFWLLPLSYPALPFYIFGPSNRSEV